MTYVVVDLWRLVFCCSYTSWLHLTMDLLSPPFLESAIEFHRTLKFGLLRNDYNLIECFCLNSSLFCADFLIKF